MKLLAITTFPPSNKPLSSFGYHAIHLFQNLAFINRITVLSDVVDTKFGESDEKLSVEQCWHYNSKSIVPRVIFAVIRNKPDLIWINLQYSLFGTDPFSAFSGLLIPFILKSLGYPVIIILHNFLAGVDIKKVGITYSKVKLYIANIADKIAMQSICSADKVFTMLPEYNLYLNQHYHKARAELIDQDLFPVPENKPPTLTRYTILTLGYFGTYKRLEVLLDAFNIIRQKYPNVHL